MIFFLLSVIKFVLNVVLYKNIKYFPYFNIRYNLIKKQYTTISYENIFIFYLIFVKITILLVFLQNGNIKINKNLLKPTYNFFFEHEFRNT